MVTIFYHYETSEMACALISWSWQTLLLLSCAWLLRHLMRSHGAWLRHDIWLCGLIGVMLLPLWSNISARLRLPQLEGMATSTPLVNLPAAVGLSPSAPPDEPATGSSQPSQQLHYNPLSFAYKLLCVLWIGGVIVTTGRVFVEARRMHCIRGRARPVTFTEINCQQLEWTKPKAARLAVTSEIGTPMLVGIVRPMILIPTDIMEWTTAEERGWMIEHETAHLSRRDNLIVIFQAMVGIIFFFHPLVRYALWQLSLERELASDDLVVRRHAVSSRYAESLLKAANRPLPQHAAAASVPFASRNTLQKRIDNIMDTNHSLKPKRKLTCLALPAALVLAVMSLLGCAGADQISRNEQEVRKFLREAAEAEIGGRPETFDRLAAPEFIRIGAEGEVWNKEQMLDAVRRGRNVSIEAVEVRDEQIRIYGNTAIVTGLGVARGHDRNGRELVLNNLCTIVLVKRDERWQCVSVQQTRQV